MMRIVGWMVLGLVAGTVAIAQDQRAPARPQEPAAAAMDSKEAAAIASYAIGMNTGRSIKDEGIEIDLDAFFQGIRDGAGGAKPKYSQQQIREAMAMFQEELKAKQEKSQRMVSEKNLREGQAFLAANKVKEGVVTLPSGLQYQILRKGNGASPKATDTVKVHYEGTLLDGTVFDSSIQRNEPAVFPVRDVIPGWTEALQQMHVGDKWKLFIPAELAYGARGAGRVIGPNSVLIFEVELLGIESSGAKPEE